MILNEEEEYILSKIFVTDVDDLIVMPKEYSLKISSANGTFFSNDFMTKQLIFSYKKNKNAKYDKNLFFNSDENDENFVNSNSNSNSNFNFYSNSNSHSNLIYFGGDLYSINSFISNLIYKPNKYFNGFDEIKIEVCDSKINENKRRNEVRNDNENKNKNENENESNKSSNMNKNENLKEKKSNTESLDEFFCSINILPIIIKSINNSPYWLSPSIVETEEDSAFNFITTKEHSSFNNYNYEELSFLNSRTSIQINDVDSFQNQIFIRLSVDLGSVFLPLLFDNFERVVGKLFAFIFTATCRKNIAVRIISLSIIFVIAIIMVFFLLLLSLLLLSL